MSNLTNFSCPPTPETTDGEKAAKTLAYTLVIFVAFLGNVFVIGVVYKNKKMRTITNFQIVNMSVADILITIAAMPPIVYQLYQGHRWPFGLVPCKLVVFLQGKVEQTRKHCCKNIMFPVSVSLLVHFGKSCGEILLPSMFPSLCTSRNIAAETF